MSKTDIKSLDFQALQVEIEKIGEKKFRAAAATEDKAAAQKLFQEQCSALDKAVKVGVIHQNKANRKKSRLAALAAAKAE